MSEEQVKEIIANYFKSKDYNVTVAWGHQHGVDINVTKGNETILIEVKGIGSRPPMRVNYFLSILGETLQRMTSDSFNYYIAFPEHEQYKKLWNALPQLAKQRTGIKMILVNEVGELLFFN